jgi:hypothetical protein
VRFAERVVFFPAIVADCRQALGGFSVSFGACACRSLGPGGVVFFQVPTYARGYHFNAKTYLRSQASESAFEMHLLPQSSIFRIIREEGGTALEVQPDLWVGDPNWESNTFLVQKS